MPCVALPPAGGVPSTRLAPWDAACAVRGATDAPKFKDFIRPLVFSKRLSDVFDDKFARHVESFGDEDVARAVIETDHADALRACDTKVATVEREAELSDELFRALPEALMTGRPSAVPRVDGSKPAHASERQT